MNTYETEKLANGLRIIYEPSATEVVYCGYVVNAGTRHEPADREGMAHFIEHMSFKGTEHRSSWHVSNALESVGGDLNAYTSKEETVFYTALPREELKRAIDVLTDMVFHSTYPQCEIDKEVEVIIDEIQSYKDSPSDLIFDEFEETIFKNHALGRKILGKAERLRTFTTADALAFTGKCYRPSNATFFLYGNIDFGRAVRMLEHATAGLTPLPAEKTVSPLPGYAPVERIVEKGTHQAHVIIGTRGLSANDKRKTPLFLLNNILGGPSMNSRLNTSLREKNGLVYTVDSFMASYTDTGLWGIYFGCDEKDISRCRRIVARELKRLTDTPLTPTRLNAAKKQIKGQIKISRDRLESYALSMGKVYSQYGRHRDVDEMCRRIDAITPDDIQAVANDIFAPERLTTLIYK